MTTTGTSAAIATNSVTIPTTASVVVGIFRRYVETRAGARQIAAWLGEQGTRTRSGGRWSTTTVLDVLRRFRAGDPEVPWRQLWALVVFSLWHQIYVERVFDPVALGWQS